MILDTSCDEIMEESEEEEIGKLKISYAELEERVAELEAENCRLKEQKEVPL